MAYWWTRQKVEIGDQKKATVEDMTGCIPLLLNECIVGGDVINLNTPFFNNISEQVATFEWEIQKNFEKKTEDLRMYGILILLTQLR
jgi:hypothetical protein